MENFNPTSKLSDADWKLKPKWEERCLEDENILKVLMISERWGISDFEGHNYEWNAS